MKKCGEFLEITNQKISIVVSVQKYTMRIIAQEESQMELMQNISNSID